MFSNYFKTAYRNLMRNKSFTLINIAGLAIGIAISLMIFLIIQFHASFDNFHARQSQIYRVLTEYHHNDSKDVFTGNALPYGLPQGIKTTFPEVEELAPLLIEDDQQIAIVDGKSETLKKFKEQKGVFYTTPSFFKIFNFPLLVGSYDDLKNPNTAFLTKETAEKYFDNWKNAIGQSIKINNRDVVKVSGIMSSIPTNTQFQFKMVVSYGTGFSKFIAESHDYDGTDASLGCFIVLPKNVSATDFNDRLIAYSKKMKSANIKDVEIIEPLSAVHFDSKAGDYSGKAISYTMIRILWLIAAFILLIACVNFVNLSTAQAVNRAKEVGVRKVLGSNKWQLKLQFITETFLIVLSSIALSLFITYVALPFIGSVLNLPLAINLTNGFPVFAFLLITCIVITLLAGFYPSIVLSGFNPITALKSKLALKSTKTISLRRGLVVFQFVIAQALIIGTLIIMKQMSFLTSQPLGFDKDAILNVQLPTDSASNTKLPFLKKQLAAISGVQLVSFSSKTPIEDNQDMWGIFNFDHSPKQTDFYSIIKTADNDYIPTYKLPLVAGRNLEASDTIKEFVVNEMLLKNLGITDPQKALGKEISFGDRTKGSIVGVMKDFNTRSLRDGLAPMLFTTLRGNYNQASIKLSSNNAMPVIHAIEKLWNNNFPDFVFEYKFLDDKIQNFYQQETQLSHLYKIFAFIAIFLSCLGLYGLASFMAVQRIKEVGVRKVLGATVQNIVLLFSKEFIVLIGISFLIATPLAWYYMHQWLQNFSFRIDLSWWLFLIGGILSIVIALATVSFQAIKAAMANPVKSLRSE